jgi:hypothetical protein
MKRHFFVDFGNKMTKRRQKMSFGAGRLESMAKTRIMRIVIDFAKIYMHQ